MEPPDRASDSMTLRGSGEGNLEVLLIGPHDDRLQNLKKKLGTAVEGLAGILNENQLVKSESTKQVELTTYPTDPTDRDAWYQALRQRIRSALFIVADITPRICDEGRVLIPNANVFYEIGLAHEADTRVFAVCDTRDDVGGRIRASIPAMPKEADITYIESHDAFDALGAELHAWFRKKLPVIAWRFRIEPSFDLMRKLYKRLKSRLGGKRRYQAENQTALRDLIFTTAYANRMQDTIIHRVRTNASLDFVEGARRITEELFSSGMAFLGDGDAYKTISTLEFWSYLGSRDRLWIANLHALGRGVRIQRLFMLKKGHVISPSEQAIIDRHEDAAAEFPTYSLRRITVDGGRSRVNSHHCGIFLPESDPAKSFGFQPVYRDAPEQDNAQLPGLGSDAPVITRINVIPDAMAKTRDFDNAWRRAGDDGGEALHSLVDA